MLATSVNVICFKSVNCVFSVVVLLYKLHCEFQNIEMFKVYMYDSETGAGSLRPWCVSQSAR